MTAIDDMQAGAEMDLLVAQKVMGWDPENEGNNSDLNPYFFDNGKWWAGTTAREEHAVYWSPSTNIAHAWEVVERLRPLGEPCVYILAPEDREVFGTWGAMVSDEVTADAIGGIGYGATAPLAICRAALYALQG